MQTIFIMLRDTCSYNSGSAQKEQVFKINYLTDGSEKLLLKSLQELHEMTIADAREDQEYYYTWIYTTTNKDKTYNGYYHGYANSEIQAQAYERFVQWFEEIVFKWAEQYKVDLIGIKRDKPCEFKIKISYDLR